MSYRLTLIFESAQEMADVLNDIALNHNELSVDVHVPEFVSAQKSPALDSLQRQADAMDRREIEIREQLWGAESKAAVRAKLRKPAHMTKADARAKRIHKEEVARRKHGMALDAIGSLGCPQCFAPKNTACSGNNGVTKEGYAHPYRIMAMARGLSQDEMAHNLSVKYARDAEVMRVIDAVDCPSCSAERFQHCVTAGGHKLGHYTHKARHIAAKGLL